MNIFGKIRLAVVGNANELLDKAIDLNSPAAVKQYVRDLESALDEMRMQAATAAGQVRTLARQKAELEQEVDHDEATIAHVLHSDAADKEAIAKQEALKIPSLKRQLETVRASLDEQTKTSLLLDQAVKAMDAKHVAMVNRIQELTVLDRTAKAKEQAARALNNASKMADAGADISVDDVESRIRARSDVADEKFNRAMGTMATLDDPNTIAEADDIVAGIKAKMTA